MPSIRDIVSEPDPLDLLALGTRRQRSERLDSTLRDWEREAERLLEPIPGLKPRARELRAVAERWARARLTHLRALHNALAADDALTAALLTYELTRARLEPSAIRGDRSLAHRRKGGHRERSDDERARIELREHYLAKSSKLQGRALAKWLSAQTGEPFETIRSWLRSRSESG